MASQTFTHVYAALVAVINTKLPQLGELLLKRLVLQFRRSYRRNDKATCLGVTKFIAHLANQQVCPWASRAFYLPRPLCRLQCCGQHFSCSVRFLLGL